MNRADLQNLRQASREGNVKTITALLPRLDPKTPAHKRWLDRSLLEAVLAACAPAAELLLKAGANPEQVTMHNTLLTFAAGCGNLPLVRLLVEAGADYNRECEGRTPLSAALSARCKPVVQYLEAKGAKSPANAALFYACVNGEPERVRRALLEGAELEQIGGIFEESPLLAAARKGHARIVKLLLKHGADPNQRGKGRAPLFGAVRFGRSLKSFEALVAAGADLHAKEQSATLLMAAAEGGSLAIVKRLVELGANINARDRNAGKTVLDYATMAKRKEVAGYLAGLGAKSDRETARALVKALAKQYGGKPVEHTRGFLLNSKFAGNVCQFHAEGDEAGVVVFKLNYSNPELKQAEIPDLAFGGQPKSSPYLTSGKKTKVQAASEFLGMSVWKPDRKITVPEGFIMDFCRRHKVRLRALNLSEAEQVDFTSETARFLWPVTDGSAALARLKLFEDLLKQVSRPPLPDRRLFEREWLIKSAPRSTAGHTLGGALENPVVCPLCSARTNLMARILLADPALPRTSLGSQALPFFWCMDCMEWDAAFFDISSLTPKPLGRLRKVKSPEAGEFGQEDVEELPVRLVPVPRGKKAGGRSKVGGSPGWIQTESTPDCPRCKNPMAFVLQLASDSRIGYGDVGMFYAFACPECKVTASLIQSH